MSCRPPDLKKYETRAVWMSRFDYKENKTTTESQNYISKNFREFKEAGLNTIIFQVRGNADALYNSHYEPWSKLLSDTLGKDPGWDPLDFAIQKAKTHGLKIHAWVNTFPAWRAEEPPPEPSTPLHPLLAHPEWVICDSAGNPMQSEHGYITFSPGIPEVQEHISAVVIDIVQNYDVDGIHFDYIRYPESSRHMGYSHDSVSISRFHSTEHNPGYYSWEIFQREQINHFVENIYNQINFHKPWVTVSAAVIGHHHTAGWNGFGAVFQDARRWMAIGKIDIIFPMTYQKIGHPTAPFDGALIQWQEITHLGRHIIPGIATYRAEREFGWGEIWDQIELIRSQNFPGMVFFSARSLARALNELSESYYEKPALTIPLYWKTDVPVILPLDLNVQVLSDSIRFEWQKQDDVHCYALYNHLPVSNPDHLIKIIPGQQTTCQILKSNSELSYYLTAVNRVGIEGPAVTFPSLLVSAKNTSTKM
jgi:uncharacterized lipoprotein YddW (UPF0748 family)